MKQLNIDRRFREMCKNQVVIYVTGAKSRWLCSDHRGKGNARIRREYHPWQIRSVAWRKEESRAELAGL
jgi:hypothetical protein